MHKHGNMRIARMTIEYTNLLILPLYYNSCRKITMSFSAREFQKYVLLLPRADKKYLFEKQLFESDRVHSQFH